MIADIDRRPILETPRLRLESLAQPDAEAIFPIMNDPEVMAHWDCGEIDDPELVAEIVRGQVGDMAAGKSLYWSIRTLGEGQFLGCCDLSEIDRWHRRADVGFMLARAAWGHGYALEAMRSVIGYAAASGLRKLGARTHLGNRRSETLLRTLGFSEEGLLRGHVLRDGERRDCHLFGLLL
jgi:ribosomal-protein-alanine N-acetyltransferase